MKKILFFFAILAANLGMAQMQIAVDVQNPTSEIGDATCSASIIGGQPPYRFQWSKRDTPLESAVCSSMQEGIPYTIVVTDSIGTIAKADVLVPAISLEEKLNKWFTPLVDALAMVL